MGFHPNFAPFGLLIGRRTGRQGPIPITGVVGAVGAVGFFGQDICHSPTCLQGACPDHLKRCAACDKLRIRLSAAIREMEEKEGAAAQRARDQKDAVIAELRDRLKLTHQRLRRCRAYLETAREVRAGMVTRGEVLDLPDEQEVLALDLVLRQLEPYVKKEFGGKMSAEGTYDDADDEKVW